MTSLGSYEFFDHTADVGITARGTTPQALFAAMSRRSRE